jgi:hypothetical protein
MYKMVSPDFDKAAVARLQIFNINFEDYYLAKHVSEQLNQT